MSRKTEIKAVETLGEAIGYGNMMDIASALWAEKLDITYGVSTGAFVPTILSNLKCKPRKLCENRQTQVRNELKNIDAV